MQEKPFVSIIIPVYNGALYLFRCLDSILSQSYGRWEAICVDDGSQDETWEILSQYAPQDSRIRIVHQENQGAAAARRTALNIMKGEYVTFLDADDTFPSDALERMVTELSKDNDADILVGGMNIITGQRMQIRKPATDKNGNASLSYLKTVLCGKNGWELWGKMYRSRLFREPLYIPKDIRNGEDAIVFIQLVCRAQRVVFCKDAVYNYIRHSSSASGIRSVAYAEETLSAAQAIERILVKNKSEEKLDAEIGTMFLLFYSNSTRKALLKSDHPLVRYAAARIRFRSWLSLPPRKAVYIFLMYLFSHLKR